MLYKALVYSEWVYCSTSFRLSLPKKAKEGGRRGNGDANGTTQKPLLLPPNQQSKSQSRAEQSTHNERSKQKQPSATTQGSFVGRGRRKGKSVRCALFRFSKKHKKTKKSRMIFLMRCMFFYTSDECLMDKILHDCQFGSWVDCANVRFSPIQYCILAKFLRRMGG